MKKLFALCLAFCLIFSLAGCGDSKTSFSGADSTPAASTESKVESNVGSSTESSTESNTESNTESSAESAVDPDDMSYPENPYAPHEIEGAEITTTDTERIINAGSFTVSVPLDWKCLEVDGQDATIYHFSHPTLGDNCKVMFEATFSVYKHDRTQEEYQKSLSRIGEDLKIESFTTGKIGGIDCIKVVSTYSVDGTKLMRIDLDNAVNGPALYGVTTIRPAENEELESVLDDIVKSIKILVKG